MTNESQVDIILHYMQEGRSITPMEALRLCGCFRLSARIHDIRERGYEIEVERIEVNDKFVASYKLKQ